MTPTEIDLAQQLAASSPYLALGLYAIRRLSVWADHLCELAELAQRLVTVAEKVSEEGVHIRVTPFHDSDDDSDGAVSLVS